MAKFAVTITAWVTKTLTVEAEDEDQAVEVAHEQFTTAADSGLPEKYNEETDSVRRL